MSTVVSFEDLSFLIVEDSAYMRMIVRTMLAGFGARKIFEAEDGADGLEKINTLNPDIVIVDWEMPVLNGPELIKFIRDPDNCRHAFLPILLLTAHTERHRIMEARRFGVNEILRKPVSPKALYQRITSIIRSPRPFVRTATYFGPEMRGELSNVEPSKIKQDYTDSRATAPAKNAEPSAGNNGNSQDGIDTRANATGEEADIDPFSGSATGSAA